MGSRHWEIECFDFCSFFVVVIFIVVVVLLGRLETVGGNCEKHINERYLVKHDFWLESKYLCLYVIGKGKYRINMYPQKELRCL